MTRYKISKSYLAIRKRNDCQVIELAFFSSLSVFTNEVNMNSISSILSHGRIYRLYCYGLGKCDQKCTLFFLAGREYLSPLVFVSFLSYRIFFCLYSDLPRSPLSLPYKNTHFILFSPLFQFLLFFLASTISPETIYLSCILRFLMNISFNIAISTQINVLSFLLLPPIIPHRFLAI